MNRRGFLSSILALGVAPAIVRADSLMRIVSRETTVVPVTIYNELLTANIVAREALKILHKQLLLSSSLYDMEYGALTSGTVVIRRPHRFGINV